MVTIFQILSLILCCNRAIEHREDKKINDIINEDRKVAREIRRRKNKDDNLETVFPNYKDKL